MKPFNATMAIRNAVFTRQTMLVHMIAHAHFRCTRIVNEVDLHRLSQSRHFEKAPDGTRGFPTSLAGLGRMHIPHITFSYDPPYSPVWYDPATDRASIYEHDESGLMEALFCSSRSYGIETHLSDLFEKVVAKTDKDYSSIYWRGAEFDSPVEFSHAHINAPAEKRYEFFVICFRLACMVHLPLAASFDPRTWRLHLLQQIDAKAVANTFNAMIQVKFGRRPTVRFPHKRGGHIC